MMPITTSVYGANLGDMLWVTPLAQYADHGLVVRLRSADAKTRATAPILDGVAQVEWVDDPAETPKATPLTKYCDGEPIRTHVTQQILAAYGHFGKPSIPRVVLTAAEITEAIALLKPYGPKTLALVNHCSGMWDPTNYRAQYVRGQPEAYVKLASFWRGAGYKVLQFGPGSDFYTKDIMEPIAGCEVIRGLSVRQLAAAYHVIGKMISADTGDYHLMLAVGGKAACLVPPHSDQMGYRHWDLHYDATCWGSEVPRVRYIEHKDWWNGMNTRLFKDIGRSQP